MENNNEGAQPEAPQNQSQTVTPPVSPQSPPLQTAVQIPSPKGEKTGTGITIVVVLLLLFITPAGIVLMWILTKWPLWVKILLTSLLLIIPILAILLAITLIAINPSKEFAQANDVKRTSDTQVILNAVEQYETDHPGILNAAITTSPEEIKSGGVDLCPALVPSYLAAFPEDPSINNGAPISSCTSYDSGYKISVDANGKLIVSAPMAELHVISTNK